MGNLITFSLRHKELPVCEGNTPILFSTKSSALLNGQDRVYIFDISAFIVDTLFHTPMAGIASMCKVS